MPEVRDLPLVSSVIQIPTYKNFFLFSQVILRQVSVTDKHCNQCCIRAKPRVDTGDTD